MYRGTTPTITLKLNTELDFSKIVQVWFTVKSETADITKDFSQVEIDNDEKTISATLSQEETLMLKAGDVRVQARVLTDDDKAFATPIKTTKIGTILKDGVIA